MKKILPIVIVAVVALGAGYFLFGGSSSEDANKDQAAAESDAKSSKSSKTGEVAAEPDKKEFGKVTDVDAITLNLADGHFLKIGISLQGSVEAGEEKLPKGPALDKVIEVFSSKTMPELMDPTVREHIHDQLNEEIQAIYTKEEGGKPEVLKIYFTEFVMQ